MIINRQRTDRPTVYCNTVLWAFVVLALFAGSCRRKHIEATPGMDSPEQTWIRVLLFGKIRECTIASQSGFLLEDLETGMVADFGYHDEVPVRTDGSRISVGEHCFNSDILIKPNDPYVFTIEGRDYRGQLRLKIEDGLIQAINSVPLESYLFGVVGAEMQSYWEPEALKTQAVCSRTYCLFIKNRFGRNRNWDLRQSESHQVYGGLQSETPAVKQAVTLTTGQVLVCRDEDGQNVLFPTYYSSSCGGHTEDSQSVFGGEQIRALSGVQCDQCRIVARHKDFYWPPVSYTIEQISEKLMTRYPALEKLGTIKDFEIDKLGYKSRVIRVRLIGTNNNSDNVRGEDFRLCLDPTGRKLKSTLFSVRKEGSVVTFQNGLGFGHGVGLCQCGAQGMARNGKTYQDILDHYFPESELVEIKNSVEP